jgi:hypothetical protein
MPKMDARFYQTFRQRFRHAASPLFGFCKSVLYVYALRLRYRRTLVSSNVFVVPTFEATSGRHRDASRR